MFTILGADGKEYGPVPADKIQEWINGGRANFQTKARRVDETDWKTLGDFPEFAVPPMAPMDAATPPLSPTPAPVFGQPLASRWSRLGARLVDTMLICVACTPAIILLVLADAFSQPATPNVGSLVAGIGALCVALFGLAIFQAYLISTTGQSLGKKMLSIRIVNHEDQGNPGFMKAFLLRSFVNSLIGAVPLIGALYSLVDVCFIFSEDKRCVHDLIAGTKVVVA